MAKSWNQIKETVATVKTNNYSWGKMKTVHHGHDFSIPLHPEHHEAIAKLGDEQEHHFKDETGRHWTARRKGADVHFQGANGGNSTVVSHASMRENYEEEVLKDQLYEVLSADAEAGDFIHDFVHSDNPKFAGKSKKERIKMALGAYYAKNPQARKVQEEVEQIEELSNKTLNSYANKATKDAQEWKDAGHRYESDPDEKDFAPAAHKKSASRVAGVKRAFKKMEESLNPAKGKWHVYDTKSKDVHSTHDTYRKAINAMNKLNDKHEGYETPGNLIQSKFGAKAVKEEVEPILEKDMGEYSTRHTVTAHVSDNTGTPADGEQREIIKKSASILAASAKDAQKAAHSHFTNKGYKVHKIEVKPATSKSTKVKMSEGTIEEGRNEGDVPFDKPYKTVDNTNINMKDKSGAVHTPMSRARDLARKAMKNMQAKIKPVTEAKKQYAGLEKEDKKGLPTAIVKTSANAVGSDTVEGWDHPAKAVKESHAPVAPVPGDKWKQHAVMVHKDTKQRVVIDRKNISHYPDHEGWSEVAPGTKLKEGKFSYKEFAMMLEYEAKGGVYRHSGSYGSAKGAAYGETDYEKDDDAEPTAKKRGPKLGSKRGTRTNLGNSKLHTK